MTKYKIHSSARNLCGRPAEKAQVEALAEKERSVWGNPEFTAVHAAVWWPLELQRRLLNRPQEPS